MCPCNHFGEAKDVYCYANLQVENSIAMAKPCKISHIGSLPLQVRAFSRLACQAEPQKENERAVGGC